MSTQDSNQASPIERLSARLATRQIETDLDAAEHLARAARLAALGNRQHWDAWPNRLRGFDLAAGIRESAKFGLWDLEHASGTFLARAVIDAGDFWTLFKLDSSNAGGSLLKEAHATIEAWAHVAEETLLDDEAADELDEFREAFPVEGELTLATLESPLGEVERTLLSMLPVAPPERIEPIGAPTRQAELVMASQFATPLTRRNFQSRSGRFTSGGGEVTLGGRLSEDWVASIMFQGPAEVLDTIARVRLGGFTLRRDASSESGVTTWSLPLGPFELSTRLTAVWQTIGVTLSDGRSLVLR